MSSYFTSAACRLANESRCAHCRAYVTGYQYRLSIACGFTTHEHDSEAPKDGMNEVNFKCPQRRGEKAWIMEGEIEVRSVQVPLQIRGGNQVEVPAQTDKSRAANAIGAMLIAALRAMNVNEEDCLICGDKEVNAIAMLWQSDPVPRELFALHGERVKKWLRVFRAFEDDEWESSLVPAMMQAYRTAAPPYQPVHGGPAEWFGAIIKDVTGMDAAVCYRCQQRQRQMDEKGWEWVQSWRGMATIARWLVSEAVGISRKEIVATLKKQYNLRKRGGR